MNKKFLLSIILGFLITSQSTFAQDLPQITDDTGSGVYLQLESPVISQKIEKELKK